MTPLPYSSETEQVAEDEAVTFENIRQSFAKIASAVGERDGRETRTSHAKATGLLRGELVIADGLPPELAQGIASGGGRFEALVRFAQGPGEVLDDKVSTHRGMSIKLLNVEGARIAESQEQATQDFVLETGPAFIHSTPKTFLADLKGGVSNAPAMPQILKSAVSNVALATNALFGNSSKILGFLGHPSKHPLAENYFSQAPMRWGDHVAKIAMAVTDETLDAIGEAHIDADGDPDAFRHAMAAFFERNGARFDLRVQLQTDAKSMPVEDASVEWPQEESPYVTVGQLILPPQEAFSEDRRRLFDEQLAFQPNNSLEAHRPLGGVMRARLFVYPLMAERRIAASGSRRAEPRSAGEALGPIPAAPAG